MLFPCIFRSAVLIQSTPHSFFLSLYSYQSSFRGRRSKYMCSTCVVYMDTGSVPRLLFFVYPEVKFSYIESCPSDTQCSLCKVAFPIVSSGRYAKGMKFID